MSVRDDMVWKPSSSSRRDGGFPGGLRKRSTGGRPRVKDHGPGRAYSVMEESVYDSSTAEELHVWYSS